jgi:hypothetical protein
VGLLVRLPCSPLSLAGVEFAIANDDDALAGRALRRHGLRVFMLLDFGHLAGNDDDSVTCLGLGHARASCVFLLVMGKRFALMLFKKIVATVSLTMYPQLDDSQLRPQRVRI